MDLYVTDGRTRSRYSLVLIILLIACTWPLSVHSEDTKWPSLDPIMFLGNPIEAEVPGHWIPMNILREIIKQRAYKNGSPYFISKTAASPGKETHIEALKMMKFRTPNIVSMHNGKVNEHTVNKKRKYNIATNTLNNTWTIIKSTSLQHSNKATSRRSVYSKPNAGSSNSSRISGSKTTSRVTSSPKTDAASSKSLDISITKAKTKIIFKYTTNADITTKLNHVTVQSLISPRTNNPKTPLSAKTSRAPVPTKSNTKASITLHRDPYTSSNISPIPTFTKTSTEDSIHAAHNFVTREILKSTGIVTTLTIKENTTPSTTKPATGISTTTPVAKQNSITESIPDIKISAATAATTMASSSTFSTTKPIISHSLTLTTTPSFKTTTPFILGSTIQSTSTTTISSVLSTVPLKLSPNTDTEPTITSYVTLTTKSSTSPTEKPATKLFILTSNTYSTIHATDESNLKLQLIFKPTILTTTPASTGSTPDNTLTENTTPGKTRIKKTKKRRTRIRTTETTPYYY